MKEIHYERAIKIHIKYIIGGEGTMKEGIHPTYYHDAVVKCACGETFVTGSTRKEIHVEICSKCHPYFTGKQKFVDTTGRVERFMKKYNLEQK